MSCGSLTQAMDRDLRRQNQSNMGDSALLSIINKLEKAKDEHTTRLVCTMDVQKAFDSPIKNV